MSQSETEYSVVALLLRFCLGSSLKKHCTWSTCILQMICCLATHIPHKEAAKVHYNKTLNHYHELLTGDCKAKHRKIKTILAPCQDFVSRQILSLQCMSTFRQEEHCHCLEDILQCDANVFDSNVLTYEPIGFFIFYPICNINNVHVSFLTIPKLHINMTAINPDAFTICDGPNRTSPIIATHYTCIDVSFCDYLNIVSSWR